MSALAVYLFLIMDSIITGWAVLFCMVALAVIIAAFCLGCEKPEYRATAARMLKRTVVLLVVVGAFWALTPNTKQVAAIYLIPKIVNNEEIRGASSDAMKILRSKMNEYLTELEETEQAAKEKAKAVGKTAKAAQKKAEAAANDAKGALARE